MSELPPGWRLVPLPVEKIEKHERYVKETAAQIAAIPRLKIAAPDTWNGKPVQSLTPEEREEFYFSMQPESTQQALLAQRSRKPSEDNEYLLRPLPDCLANPEAQSLDELTAKRSLGLEETLLVEDIRRKGRNTTGQSVEGSVSEERRTAGIEAFTYSKPATLNDSDMWRIKSLNEIDAIVAQAEAPKSPADKDWERSWYWRCSSWLQKKTGIWWF